jgi:hypothetical protein
VSNSAVVTTKRFELTHGRREHRAVRILPLPLATIRLVVVNAVEEIAELSQQPRMRAQVDRLPIGQLEFGLDARINAIQSAAPWRARGWATLRQGVVQQGT